MSSGPTYAVEFSRDAKEAMAKLPRDARVAIGSKIDALRTDPRPHGCLKLTNASGYYRIRAGNYRVVYDVRDATLFIFVVKVGSRKDVYEGL